MSGPNPNAAGGLLTARDLTLPDDFEASVPAATPRPPGPGSSRAANLTMPMPSGGHPVGRSLSHGYPVGRNQGGRAAPSRAMQPGASGRPRRWVDGNFIQGPISLEWLHKAWAVGRAAIGVAHYLLWLASMSGTGPDAYISLNQSKLSREGGMSEKVVRTGIHALEEAGLIKVSREPGKTLRVQVVGAFGRVVQEGHAAASGPPDRP